MVPRSHCSHSAHHAGVRHQHDVITGFCGETQEEHEATLSLMDEVRYDMAFMFKYSERPKTLAERKFEDDVPEDVKGARLKRSSPAKWCTERNGRKPWWVRCTAC